MSSRRRRLTSPPYSGPWQLLGFGKVDTPERRYAVLDPSDVIHWAGDSVHAAMEFIMVQGIELDMERDSNGDAFIRESEWPPPPRPVDRHALPGRSGIR